MHNKFCLSGWTPIPAQLGSDAHVHTSYVCPAHVHLLHIESVLASCIVMPILPGHVFPSHVSYLLASSMASELAVNLTTSYMAFHHSTTAGTRYTGYPNQFAYVFLSF